MPKDNTVEIIIRAKDLASSGARNAQRAFSGLRGGVQRLEASMFGLKSVVVGLGAALGAGALAKSALDTAASFERLQIQLDTLTKGEGAAWFKALNDWALKMPVNTQQAITMFARLRAMGLKPSIQDMTTLVDTTSALGGGVDVMNGIALALGQIHTKGKVSAEELRQLAERGIPAYEILQQKFHLTAQELANIGNSALDADEAVTALIEGMQQRFGGASARMQTAWSGMIEALKSYWAEFQRKVMDSGPFTVLRGHLQMLIKWLDQVKKDGRLDLWARDMALIVIDSFDAMIRAVGLFGKAINNVKTMFVGLKRGQNEAVFDTAKREADQIIAQIERLQSQKTKPIHLNGEETEYQANLRIRQNERMAEQQNRLKNRLRELTAIMQEYSDKISQNNKDIERSARLDKLMTEGLAGLRKELENVKLASEYVESVGNRPPLPELHGYTEPTTGGQPPVLPPSPPALSVVQGPAVDDAKRKARELLDAWVRVLDEILASDTLTTEARARLQGQYLAARKQQIQSEAEDYKEKGVDRVTVETWVAEKIKAIQDDIRTYNLATLQRMLSDEATTAAEKERVWQEVRDRIAAGEVGAWDAFRLGVEDAREHLNLLAQDMMDFGNTVVGSMQSSFKSLFKGLTEGDLKSFENAWDAFLNSLLDALSNVLANQMTNALTAWLNWAMQALMSVFGSGFGGSTPGLPSTDVTVPSGGYATGGIVPGSLIPLAQQPVRLAMGGVMSRPTLAWVAEAGQREAVVPLPDGRSIPVQMTGDSQQQPNVTVNLVGQGADDAEVNTRMDPSGMVVDIVLDNIARRGSLYHTFSAIRGR